LRGSAGSAGSGPSADSASQVSLHLLALLPLSDVPAQPLTAATTPSLQCVYSPPGIAPEAFLLSLLPGKTYLPLVPLAATDVEYYVDVLDDFSR